MENSHHGRLNIYLVSHASFPTSPCNQGELWLQPGLSGYCASLHAFREKERSRFTKLLKFPVKKPIHDQGHHLWASTILLKKTRTP